jgi:hypothetical protein
MPWKSRACETQIQHEGDAPLPKKIYRCHVCRLELMLDESLHELTVAPLQRSPCN